MPRSRDADNTEGSDSPRLSLGERLKKAMLKPEPPSAPTRRQPESEPETVEEIEAAIKQASDKERLIGLIGAPLSAAIGVLVLTALVDDDPAVGLPNHVNVSLYHELTFVLLGLSLLMLAAAWFRKRLYLGITMVCFGLAIFNLHYWGFGVPFILAAAWLLVRSFRLQRSLREATGDLPGRRGTAPRANGSRPSSNKRYTPPTTPPKRPTRSKLEGEQKAG